MKSKTMVRHVASLAGLVVFVILAVGSVDDSSSSSSSPDSKTSTIDLSDNVRFDGTQLIIQNTASYDTLQIGSFYRISRESPLMPEFEPTDPLGAIARMISLPASSTILIREKRYKRGTPWYRTEAYGLKGTRIGEGWINSIALMGQRLTRVD